MQDMDLHWNPKKCNVLHVKRGNQVQDAVGTKLNQSSVVESLKPGTSYKFLGVQETVTQDEKLALECAAKVYLKRLSVIWSSPLSDINRVRASSQYAMPVLTYLMWTQHWPITELRVIDREARKIICENGGKHPLSLTAIIYLAREKGGRGLRSVEREYKLTKIKAAIKLCQNMDPSMRAVQQVEERAVEKGHTSLMKEAHKFAEELGISLSLEYPQPSCWSVNDPETEIQGPKAKEHLKKADMEKLKEKIKEEKWHGRFLQARWQDSELNQSGCFAWLRDWTCAPTHTIAGVMELYEQLTPTKVYTVHKTGVEQGDVTCRLFGKSPETLAHVLAGCSALAQSKYLERHNAALKVLFFEMTRDLRLIDSVPPWYSCAVPKPVYESSEALAFWDVPVYAEHTIVKANRVDARFVDHKNKKVWAVEMSCPWMEHREKKSEEKTVKYGPLRFELKKRYPGYDVEQCNMIIDVPGGWSRDVDLTMRKLFGSRGYDVLRRMQKATISSSLNIVRTFKATVN